ncbi:MAG: extracellular solute-binding protein [Ruminococcaceae bacterium]|nr:extracellular solute-binding protein [Oscillospiraceae bacterium]
MRRFGLILCVIALMCQFLAMPVYAEPIADDTLVTDHIPDLNAAANFVDEEYDYNQYVKDQNSSVMAQQAVTINATDVAEKTDSVVVQGSHLLWGTEKDSSATWNVEVPADGWYTVSFTYAAVPGGSSDIELGFLLNGNVPFPEAERFTLPRIWVDDGGIRESNGNQFAPEQKQLYTKQTRPLRDVNGFVSEDLRVYLTAGSNYVSLVSYGEGFKLYGIELGVPKTVPTLKQALAQWKAQGIQYYSGQELVLEAENTDRKNDRSVIGKSDNSNPGVTPCNPYKQMVNYIGGSNWSMPDEYITWKVSAPKAGIYKLGFHFRQNYLINATSYRSLKVNGEYQYAEQESLAFDYGNGWQFSDTVLKGKELLVYLDKGSNELTMSVTLGDMSTFSAKMETMVLRLGRMYLDIVSIVGETPDSNRDYDLFKRISDLEQRMRDEYKRIEGLIAERTDADGNIDDIAALLQKMNVVIEKMVEKQYEAQLYKGTFYDCYASLSAQLQEMKNMALDIDCIVFTAPGRECQRTTAGFFSTLQFEAERFIASFMLDYNNTASSQGKENLTIWVNWSRDQTLVLNSLITSKFTPQYNIGVTVRMTNASLLQGIMSGNGPDCSLSDSRTTPINLAMRGALVDLSKMEGYDDLFYGPNDTYGEIPAGKTIKPFFAHGSDEPYRYGDGVYALPATQQFYMMFYRTDVFEKYGIVDENGVAKPPKTWDEFLEIASIFMLNNMQVGLPYTELKDIGQVNGGVASLNIFPTLLMQEGLSIYNKDMTGTSFAEVDTMRVFEEWTDYYTKYNLPKEYSFFNRFRVGQVPMAIQAYGQYSALAAAAPEIKGRWEMAEIPGTPVVDENGNPVIDPATGEQKIDNRQAGFGSACMILELSEHKEASWKLLKWWMSEETQYSYSLDIESILGVAGRYSSANVDATLNLDWGKEASNILGAQWKKVDEIREIPGGYYVSRAVDQAFWNVLSMNANPKDMMKKWGEVADVEITSKIEQYKHLGKGGAN